MTAAVQQLRTVSANPENDLVALTVGGTPLRFGYTTGFRIAQAMRVAANHVAALEGVALRERQELKRPAPHLVDPDSPIHGQRRQTENQDAGKPWSVDINDKTVLLIVGNITVGFEFDDAFQVAGWIRECSQQAKRWAGDTSRTIRAAGHLSNAEDNALLAGT